MAGHPQKFFTKNGLNNTRTPPPTRTSTPSAAQNTSPEHYHSIVDTTAYPGYTTHMKFTLLLLTAALLQGCISFQATYPLPGGGKATVGFSK